MKIILDLETTGIPLEKSRFKFYPPNDIDKYNSSRIVEIGYIICDDKNQKIAEKDFIIKPDNFIIQNEHIHHISQELAELKGQNIKDVFTQLYEDIKNCNILISHNINFDYNVLFSECIRYNNQELILKLNNIEKYCTMLEGQKKLNLYKWPKLILLVDYFFPDEKWDQKHNALDDAQYCFKCYCRLENM